MKVFISVVSHQHGKVISNLDCLIELGLKFHVVVKNNTEDQLLLDYLDGSNVSLIDEQYGLGFGKNNNLVYKYCKENLYMSEDDIFIVCNPDVFISVEQVVKLKSAFYNHNVKIATINLYKDFDLSVHDHALRRFPNLWVFASSILGFGNSSILDKDNLVDMAKVDWAAGSFLAFLSSHYANISGFDEKYFMYCEDIDICYRSYLLSHKVIFLKEITAVHFAKHNNRSVFSMHFIWHLKSAFRFLATKRGFTKLNSILRDGLSNL